MDFVNAEVQVKVVFFAQSKEAAGVSEAVLSVPKYCTAQSLLSRVIEHFPGVEKVSKTVVLALNAEYLDLKETAPIELTEASETITDMKICIQLSNDSLTVDKITETVTFPTCGAISLFIGTTRNNFNGKKVLKLDYSAYNVMAEKEMHKVCMKAAAEWPDIEGIAISHRLGEVPIGEASVVIAVASPHRQSAMSASAFCIDTLKATVPIWKKEIYEEGDSAWKENPECPWSSRHQQ